MGFFSIQACYFALLLNCIFAAQAKIVYLNGTEIVDDNLKNANSTTLESVQKRFSVFNPKNISNHSGNSERNDPHPLDWKTDEKQPRENDEKERTENILDEENYQSSNDSLVKRDATVLSSLRGVFDGLAPMVTILSTIIGLFIIFVMIQSPLSPLPVPPLPYPPIGPFPPTNIYPFGVPPAHPAIPYSVRYNGPIRYVRPVVYTGALQGGYRVPRNFKTESEKRLFFDMLQNVIAKVASSNATTAEDKFLDIFVPIVADICIYLDKRASLHLQKFGGKNIVEGIQKVINITERNQEEKFVTEENKATVATIEEDIIDETENDTSKSTTKLERNKEGKTVAEENKSNKAIVPTIDEDVIDETENNIHMTTTKIYNEFIF